MPLALQGTIPQDLRAAASPTFLTVKLSGLAAGYFPYHVDDATGLADSPIFTDGTNTGIGTAGPNALLHVGAGSDSPLLSGTSLFVSNAGDTVISARDSTNNREIVLGISSSVGVIGTRTPTALYFQTAAANNMMIDASGNIRLGYSGANTAYIKNDGNVGVATILAGAGVTYQKFNINGAQLFVGADSTQESPMFQVVPSYVVNTHASYTSRTILSQWAIGGAQEVMRFESGAAAMIGFLGAGAVVRQTGYGVPTDLTESIAALTALRTAMINYGLITTV